MLLCGTQVDLLAQGVTTATIGGVVTDERGLNLEAAAIQVIDRSTGFETRGLSHTDGRYLVQGLAVGGPYTVVVRRIGFRAQTRDSLVLALGQYLRLDFVLEMAPTELSAVTVEARRDPTFSASHTGVAATLTDAMLHRLPLANRDLYSFLSLVPQMSTGYGPSGGGVNFRFNNYQLDGASDQAVYGNNAAASVWGAKPISIEAVQEYQVLLSPYEVREGDFAGALIKGVTKRGTNQLHGTAFAYASNERLARNVPVLRASPYDRTQFGFTVGGPVIRDRMHFFVAAEFQRLHTPAPGPYIGQDSTAQRAVPVTTAQVDSFVRILQGHGVVGGSGGPVTNSIPASNLFGRLDVALPTWNSRLLIRYNYSHADSGAFSRSITTTNLSCFGPSCFPLSSLLRRFSPTKHSAVVQLSNHLRSGAYNELRVGYTTLRSVITPDPPQPLILANVPDAGGKGLATLQAGTGEGSQVYLIDQRVLDLGDNVTVPSGGHRFTAGATTQFWHVRNFQLPGSYGIWEFASLDSLEQGIARVYRVTIDQGGADATLRGVKVGLFAGDQWQAGAGLSLTFGLRLDVPLVSGTPPYSPSVDSAFGRRTDVIPSGNAQWSPRVGFNWDLPGKRRQQVRGGAGLFAGRPPLAWLLQAFQNYGSGQAILRCSPDTVRDPGLPPPFPGTLDYRNPPTACANGVEAARQAGLVNLAERHLRFPQTFRATLAYDRELPGGVVATLEGLYTKAVQDFMFVNRNLKDTSGSDRNGRTMYGTLDTLGVAAPNLVSQRFRRVDVTELQNQSRNWSYSVTAQLAKRFSSRVETRVAYSYSRTRDVQTHYPSTINAGEEWRAQPYSGRQDEQRLAVSGFDQPHRIVLVGTFTPPWRTWQTDFSFYYVGGSGTPYTYIVTGISTPTGARTGDLNADGTSGNDPVYVPASAYDTAEIRFAGTSAAPVAAQQQAFAEFINGAPCLRQQRGRIIERNSCRSPWIHTLNTSLRQAFPSFRGHTLAVQVDIFNLLNLLSSKWGLVKLPYTTSLLTHVGQNSGRSVFRFDPTMPRYNSQNLDSYYQIQLSARYSF
jgi:hypothetical protein